MNNLQGLIIGLLVGAMLTAGIFLWDGSCPDSEVPAWMKFQASTTPNEWVEHDSCSICPEHHWHGLTNTVLKTSEREFRGVTPDGDSLWGWHNEW